ncbi:hypothetical protein KA005_62430 [bacterium]|nr:hypothetical protein [bacterium]
MNFKQVLVTDKVASSFFAIAEKEGMLYSRNGEEVPVRKVSAALRQRILSLIVLFDKVLVHDFAEGTFRIPDLEIDGIIEVKSADEPLRSISPLSTKWSKGYHGPRDRPPKPLLKSLRLMEEYRHLIISRLSSHRSEFNKTIAKSMGYSYRRYLEEFLAYATAYARGDDKTLSNHPLGRIFGNKQLKYIKEELFDYSSLDNGLSPTNATLLMASVFANEIAVIIDLSRSMGVGVATEDYGQGLRSAVRIDDKELDTELASKHYLTIRSIVAEQKGMMPQIEGIRHALKFRSDPYLKAMRSELCRINESIMKGDRDIVVEALNEFNKASSFLSRSKNLNKALKFLTFVSVPVSVIEALFGAPPVAGLSVASLSACGMQVSNSLAKKGEWILFGG